MLTRVKDAMLMTYSHESLVEYDFNKLRVHLEEGDWAEL
jgi:hypothetical protein